MGSDNKKLWENGVLSVDASKKYFTNGKQPFFWLGDTAWSLFRLNDEETYLYLKNRADKGFTVIQCVLMRLNIFTGGRRVRRGETVVPTGNEIQNMISEENESYWKHVDDVLKMAEDMGLYMAALPVWGSVVGNGFLTLDNVSMYADFLIKRYGKRPNIIWVTGGDIRGDKNFNVWDTLGKTLKAGCPDKLIGYHPFGRTSSSYWFNDCEWLDFNMFQSGHRRYDQRNLYSWDDEAANEPWHGEDNWRYVEHDHALTPLRPVLDAEPSYEQIPQGLHDASEPRWQDYHVRRYGYWSVMAGACGHTYGHTAVFQFFGKDFSPPGCAVAETWEVAIHHPGASQMQILKDVMHEIKWYKCAPVDIVMDKGQKTGYITAFGNEDNVLIYDYLGRFFAVRAEGYEKADAWWIDPACGVRSYMGRFNLTEGKVFFPPVKPIGQNDWLLLLKKPE